MTRLPIYLESRLASMVLELASSYYSGGEGCMGLQTQLAAGGTGVTFWFWNRWLEPHEFDLRVFEQILRRLKLGPVESSRGTGYGELTLTVGPTNYPRFKSLLRSQLWDQYRKEYHRVKNSHR